ncbi:MAG: FKBP-type peptidyl-prolyl cis-trans isomerase [Treponema sp.]|nr:FKBP-type peptidyl-prolyl cis-trans isomerase [Treponema sp.]
MKKILLGCGLFFLMLSVQANGIRDDLNFTGEKARTSYAFGMAVGGDLEQIDLDIDYYAFTEGLRAAMEHNQAIMDRDEALEIVQDVFESSMRKQNAELKEKEELFLAENAARAGMQTTESGLQYIILEEGSGPKPAEHDIVRVHYEGALVDGTVFDSSYERDEPEEFSLDMVIPGWAEGIMLMNVGAKHRLYLPSDLGYGERGAGQVIPPYSTLVFTVELLGIVENSKDFNISE